MRPEEQEIIEPPEKMIKLYELAEQQQAFILMKLRAEAQANALLPSGRVATQLVYDEIMEHWKVTAAGCEEMYGVGNCPRAAYDNFDAKWNGNE